MNAEAHIEKFISGQAEPKRTDLRLLHQRTLQLLPGCRLTFHDGLNGEGKVIANPTIGYGIRTIHYANGSTKESFQVGLSANKTGISIYILGIEDKTYLTRTYAKDLGKASVTGYCIRFKALKDIDIVVLESAIKNGIEQAA